MYLPSVKAWFTRPQVQRLSLLSIFTILGTTALLLSASPCFSQTVPSQDGMPTLLAQLASSDDRWIEIRRITGNALLRGQPAQVGDRLRSVGDRLITGPESSVTLVVDDGIGVIEVSENTELQVSQLSIGPDGSRITDISTTSGQARLEVRRFTNPNSRLSIQTPGGVTAVRGTAFGVTVGPSGQTAVFTEEGQVDASAQRQTVSITPNQATIIVPGQAPTVPEFFVEDLGLQIVIRNNFSGLPLTLMGTTSPLNLVSMNGEAVGVDVNGAFEVAAPLGEDSVFFTVRSPMGNQRTYEIQIQ